MPEQGRLDWEYNLRSQKAIKNKQREKQEHIQPSEQALEHSNDLSFWGKKKGLFLTQLGLKQSLAPLYILEGISSTVMAACVYTEKEDGFQSYIFPVSSDTTYIFATFWWWAFGWMAAHSCHRHICICFQNKSDLFFQNPPHRIAAGIQSWWNRKEKADSTKKAYC